MLSRRNLSYTFLIILIVINLLAEYLMEYKETILNIVMALSLIVFLALYLVYALKRKNTLYQITVPLCSLGATLLVTYIRFGDLIESDAIAYLHLYGSIVLLIAGFVIDSMKTRELSLNNMNLLSNALVIGIVWIVVMIVKIIIDKGYNGYDLTSSLLIFIVGLIMLAFMLLVCRSSVYTYEKEMCLNKKR